MRLDVSWSGCRSWNRWTCTRYQHTFTTTRREPTRRCCHLDWNSPTSHIRPWVDCPNLYRRHPLHHCIRHLKTKTTWIRLKNGASQLRFLFPIRPSLKRTVVYVTWLGKVNPPRNAESQVRDTNKQRKKSYALFSKRRFVYVVLVEYINFPCTAPKSVELCGDERKNLRINRSSCTEKQPMRNRATRQFYCPVALWGLVGLRPRLNPVPD